MTISTGCVKSGAVLDRFNVSCVQTGVYALVQMWFILEVQIALLDFEGAGKRLGRMSWHCTINSGRKNREKSTQVTAETYGKLVPRPTVKATPYRTAGGQGVIIRREF